MKFEVPEYIVKQTTRCDNNFLCLSEEWKPCGKANRIIEGKLVSVDIDPKLSRDCHYGVPFGWGYYCLCPTRVEIYKRYKI
jgi:hypothetical protein